MVPGQAPLVYATGFTNIIDVAFGPAGGLLVLELRHNGLLPSDRLGAPLHVRPGGGGTPAVLMTSPLVEPTAPRHPQPATRNPQSHRGCLRPGTEAALAGSCAAT